jgi:hypothetical protein
MRLTDKVNEMDVISKINEMDDIGETGQIDEHQKAKPAPYPSGPHG